MQPQVQTGSSPVIQSNKGFRVWWQLTRPHTLTAAFVPVLLGTVLAIDTHDIHIGLFLSMLFASLLIQAATNMFNEYYDFKRGLDNENSVGIGGTIVRDGVQPKTVLRLAFGFYGLAFLLGLYICANSSWWLALIGIICMAAGYFYTGGPMPIAYTPFGEVVAGFFMGILIILIAYFLQTGTVDTRSILVSIPISILVGQILMANNIRDLDGDKINGRKTLAILLGRKRAIQLLAVMFVVSYVWIFAMILTGTVSPWLAVIILSVPKAIKATKGFIGKTMPIEMMPAMKATAQTNTIFGFLLSVGLMIHYIISL